MRASDCVCVCLHVQLHTVIVYMHVHAMVQCTTLKYIISVESMLKFIGLDGPNNTLWLHKMLCYIYSFL